MTSPTQEYIRFVAPDGKPNLVIPGLASFSNYFYDIPVDQVEKIGQMRYRSPSYGVKELGAFTRTDSALTEADVAADILDATTAIGAAVSQRVGNVDNSALSQQVAQLRIDVDALNSQTGDSAVQTGTEFPSTVIAGSLVARFRTY